eukprot:TRINITY_DN7276_c0_g1_i2.p1 TRINITY_DN7276_c0_g1~~TRINITY_DN7276_c0_g1_i2.p1  ORF type:complete len:126 (-),score=33.03 TRINITY_DN7276_c0_g1_i2:81-458(-)
MFRFGVTRNFTVPRSGVRNFQSSQLVRSHIDTDKMSSTEKEFKRSQKGNPTDGHHLGDKAQSSQSQGSGGLHRQNEKLPDYKGNENIEQQQFEGEVKMAHEQNRQSGVKSTMDGKMGEVQQGRSK